MDPKTLGKGGRIKEGEWGEEEVERYLRGKGNMLFFFLRKIAGFILSFFTRNHQRSNRKTLNDSHPNHEDRGDYATLDESAAPSYNHQARLASPDVRIGIHGENYEKSGPSNSASKVGHLPQIPVAIQPRSTEEQNHEFHQKPKVIPPLPPPPRVLHSKSVDPGTERPVDSSLPSNPSPFSSQPPPFPFKPAPSSSQTPQSSLSLPLRPSSIQPPQFSSDPPPSSSRLPSSCSKPTLSPLTSNPTNQQKKENYVLFQTETPPIYEVPEEFKDLIKKNIVPGVLKKPVSPLTYKDYFAALLYAEDFYVEKTKAKGKLVPVMVGKNEYCRKTLDVNIPMGEHRDVGTLGVGLILRTQQQNAACKILRECAIRP
ncbi:hypothetical protein L1049_022639 [Liquidambar formosana]|uniref:Uncharacterized protein n=1 Tax=Liquidambar formosana TaxID=63359 RepID=A0AAP0RE86_LIQFO